MGKKTFTLKPKLSFNSLHSSVHMEGTPVILVRKDNESLKQGKNMVVLRHQGTITH